METHTHGVDPIRQANAGSTTSNPSRAPIHPRRAEERAYPGSSGQPNKDEKCFHSSAELPQTLE
jgi:hypothetical protein